MNEFMTSEEQCIALTFFAIGCGHLCFEINAQLLIFWSVCIVFGCWAEHNFSKAQIKDILNIFKKDKG